MTGPTFERYGRKPIFANLPDLDLELFDPTVLDGRLVVLEYRPLRVPTE